MNTPRWVLSPELLDFLPKIEEFIAMVELHGIDNAHNLWLETEMDKGPLQRHEGFFTCPVLSADACDFYLEFADKQPDLFKPNAKEELEYQIPEIVLPTGLATLSRKLAEEALWPLFHLMYGTPPNHFSSIQLARYRQGLGTGWHHDEDSEATCVVSLAPERHVGGGTAILPAGATAPAVVLPPLPKGSALLFNGRQTLHRGLPTAKGERNLLVFWMMHNHNRGTSK
jgi:hypothetical protein